MARKMHILLRLLGLVVFAATQLPLISCQYTGYGCGGESSSSSSCSNLANATTEVHQTQHQRRHPVVENENRAEEARESTSFLDYANVGDGARKCLEIARRIWNANRALKLYVFRDENDESFAELRFAKAPGDDEDVDHQQNEVGRTFGIRRRMQLLLWLPISFKLGVIVTLLLVLTTMSLKTLLIGFIILFLLLTRTNLGPAKVWGAQRNAELAVAASDLHRNVHIHVHTLPEDALQQHQAYAAAAASEPWQGSPSFAVQHS